MWVQSLGWEDTLEKGMATHSSIFAWRIWWAAVHGVAQSWTWLKRLSTHAPSSLFQYLLSGAGTWIQQSPQLVFVNEKYVCHQFKKKKKDTAAIKPSCYSHPCGKPWGNSGWENTGYWPQVAEVPIKGIISVSPDSCIFSYIEMC